MSAVENLKKLYQDEVEARRVRAEAEAQRIETEVRAKLEQGQAAAFAQLAPLPDGVRVEWDAWPTQDFQIFGEFVVEDRRVNFSVHREGDLDLHVKVFDHGRWRKIEPAEVGIAIGAAIAAQDDEAAKLAAIEATLKEEEARRETARIQAAAEKAAEHARWQAESDKNRAEAAAREAANAAHDETVEAKLLARRVAEAEAIVAAQAKHLVNPSGLVLEDIDRWANQAIESATDAGARLPAVEQLRTEIGIFERQLKEAQAAATWGTGGANDTERKNNAARALAADPQVKQIQAALDEMNRRLAEIESEYRAVAMKSGAWRAVAELYAGWLQSLR